jgi:WD40 repeat protein
VLERAIIAATLLLLGACGGDALSDATGPALEAAVERSWRLDDMPARQARFSPDGSLVVLTGASGRVALLRTSDWRLVRNFTHDGGATAAAFSADARTLYTAGYDGAVRVWDLAAGRQIAALTGAHGTLWTIDVAADGRIAAAGEDMLIRVWGADGAARPLLTLAGHTRNVWEVRFSPDGRTLASGSFDATARLWDAASGRPLRTLSGHSQAVVGLDFSPDGSTLATGGDDSAIRFWRVGDGALVRTIASDNHVYKLDFSPDGRWLASAGRARSGLGTIWHSATGAGGAAAPAHLWRVADGAHVRALAHAEDVMSIGFSPRGDRLVTAAEDGAIAVWRVRPTMRAAR